MEMFPACLSCMQESDVSNGRPDVWVRLKKDVKEGMHIRKRYREEERCAR